MEQRPLPRAGRKWKLLVGSIAFLAVAAMLGFLYPYFASEDAPVEGRKEDAVDRLAKEYAKSAPSQALDEILAQPDVIPSHAHPLLGQPAPDFSLLDTDDRPRRMQEIRQGRAMLLIFYYGYYCDHCVRQLFDVRRDREAFACLDVRMAAVSADPAEETRRRFAKYGPFDFPVLSDPDNQTAQKYAVMRGGLIRHGTFLIDRGGTVRWVNVGDAPFRRNTALLTQLAAMEGLLHLDAQRPAPPSDL